LNVLGFEEGGKAGEKGLVGFKFGGCGGEDELGDAEDSGWVDTGRAVFLLKEHFKDTEGEDRGICIFKDLSFL
jgi:hypothetical protein